MGIVEQYYERVRLTLKSKAEEAGLFDHRGTIGAARELLVSEFLETTLPREFDFVSGEVVAPCGGRSGQLDVMLIPRSAPAFRLAPRLSLGLVHTVAAVLEVKSKIDGRELSRALEGIVRLRSLGIVPRHDPWPWSAGRKEDAGQCQVAASRQHVELPSIPASIVAFRGMSANEVERQLIEWSRTHGETSLPDTVTCLDENFTLTRNNGWVFPLEKQTEEQKRMLYIRSGKSCLVDLCDYLMKAAQAYAFARPRTPISEYI